MAAGTAKKLVDQIITQRANGNTTLMHTTRTKLLLKGLHVDSFTATLPDDPAIIAKIRQVATEMNVKV